MSKLDTCTTDAEAFAKLKAERPGERVVPKQSAADYEAAMTELAKRDQQRDESLAMAYTRMLDTEEGGLLYGAHCAAMRAEQLGKRGARDAA